MYHSQFWRLEVQGQGASVAGFRGEPYSGLQTADLSFAPSLDRERKTSLEFLL